MDIYSKTVACVVGFACFLAFAIPACDKAVEDQKPVPQQAPTAPQQVQQAPPLPAPVQKPYADNPFIHEPPPPPTPALGHKTLAAQLQFIGSYKMNDCWLMNLWRDNANGTTCYIAECEAIHIMSCVRDEVANTK